MNISNNSHGDRALELRQHHPFDLLRFWEEIENSRALPVTGLKMPIVFIVSVGRPQKVSGKQQNDDVSTNHRVFRHLVQTK